MRPRPPERRGLSRLGRAVLTRLPWPAAGALIVAAGLSACAPGHDWRQARSVDGAVGLLFPCRPLQHDRRVPLAGASERLTLLSCEAGGQVWALASADLADPARLSTALDELALAAAANLSATAATQALRVPGATPHPGSRRLTLAGRRPDGQPAQMQAALFVHGTHVYQATVLGQTVPAEVAEVFFDSLRVAP